MPRLRKKGVSRPLSKKKTKRAVKKTKPVRKPVKSPAAKKAVKRAPLKTPKNLAVQKPKKTVKKAPTGTKAGMITHFFNKIQVGVIRLESPVSVGDKLKILRQGRLLGKEKVLSMQINHIPVESARKGEEIGLKMKTSAAPGDEVFKT
jgi:hypothetical protein